METKEIIESGFFRAFIREYVEHYCHYHYMDHDRLIYALCNSVEEKNIATRGEIELIKQKIRELGHEEMSFDFLMRYQSKNPHAFSEQKNDPSYWENHFYEFFINEITSLQPVTDDWKIIEKEAKKEDYLNPDDEYGEAIYRIDQETRNIHFVMEREEELVEQIENNIDYCKENDDWEFDFDYYRGYVPQSDPFELLFDLCDLLVQLFRLRMFEDFLDHEQEEIKNNQINQDLTVIQNDQIKFFLDPYKFLQFKKVDLNFNLTKENNCSEEKAEEIYRIIIEIIDQLKETRTSKSLSEDVISRKKEELPEIDGRLFEHWLLKALEFDDTYVYAHNMLAQQTNRQMRMNACPLKSVSVPYLFQLLENEKAQVESINKPKLQSHNIKGENNRDPNGLNNGSLKGSKSTINFLSGPDSDKLRLLEFLIETYSGKRGKSIAIMILALEENKLIAYTEKSELYSAIRVDFGNIGSDAGINKFLTINLRMDKDHLKIVSLHSEKIKKHIENSPK